MPPTLSINQNQRFLPWVASCEVTTITTIILSKLCNFSMLLSLLSNGCNTSCKAFRAKLLDKCKYLAGTGKYSMYKKQHTSYLSGDSQMQRFHFFVVSQTLLTIPIKEHALAPGTFLSLSANLSQCQVIFRHGEASKWSTGALKFHSSTWFLCSELLCATENSTRSKKRQAQAKAIK